MQWQAKAQCKVFLHSCLRNMINKCCNYLVFHYKHMMDRSSVEDCRWKLQFFLAYLSAAHPALTIVNEFSLTKEGCPAAWPHRAPPRSTGPWTRHSKPTFSIFQCSQEPADFIGVFKSYSLKHSSSVSTHSRQFHFFSLPHFIFIPPPSHCCRHFLSFLKLLSRCPGLPFPPLILQLIPRAYSSGSVWPGFFFLNHSLIQSTLPTQMLVSAILNSAPASFFHTETKSSEDWGPALIYLDLI